MRNVRILGIVLLATATLLVTRPVAAVDGTTNSCDDFQLELVPIVTELVDLIPGLDIRVDIADEGWVWIRPLTAKYQSVSGVVTESKVAVNDLQANHNSHDHNTFILVDPGQEDILSPINGDNADDPRSPDSIEVLL